MKSGAARTSLLLPLLLAACRLGEAPPERVPTPAVKPEVSVGILIDTASAAVGASTAYEIATLDGRVVARGNADAWTVAADRSGQITGTNGRERFGPVEGPLRLRATGSGTTAIAGKPYRGTVLLRGGARGLTVVNVVDIEDYLLGVVPLEIGRLPANLIEAVKAQAVAARTYAVGNLGGRRSLGFDFYATVMDQVYGGLSAEDTVVSRAVRETAGEIVTHNGRPILAYYSSTCGGRTASIQDSWPWRAPQPYLRSVSDTIPGTDQAYCQTSSRFRWTAAWSGDSLKAILTQTLRERIGNRRINRIERIALTGRTSSGRAEAVRIQVDDRSFDIPADSIRWVLRPDGVRLLNSSLLFSVSPAMRADTLHSLEISGAGWGHGIGMCQVGAIGRARAGIGYRDILRAYYTDTAITRAY